MKKILLAGLLAGFATTVTAVLPATAGDVRIDGFPDFNSHLDKQIPNFKKSSPDINVTYQMNNHGDHHKKLTTNLATGSGAGDVVIVDVGFIGAFTNAGGFVDLSAAPYNADAMKDKFVSYAWDQGKGTDGKQYAIPVDIGPGVLYYRRDIFDAAGVKIDDVIKDWDSYIALGQKLKEKKIFLIADAGDVAGTIVRTTVKEGEGLFFDADGNSLITSDRFVKAFTIAKRIRDAGLDAQIGAWTNEWYDGFKKGTVATQLSGAWLLGHLQNWMARDTEGKWGVSNLPDGIFGSWGGSFLAIPKQAANKEDAWKLIQFLSNKPETQIASLKDIGAFPVLTEVYNDAAFEEPLEFLAGQKARKLFASIAQKVPAVAAKKGDLIAEDVVMKGALLEVLNDGKDIMTALKDAERLVKRRVK